MKVSRLSRGKQKSNKSGENNDKGTTCILGQIYKLSLGQVDNTLKQHSKSSIRLTYRRDFQAMAPYYWLTSDSGWGCMLRSVQMIMASAMQRHYLGSNWRFPVSEPSRLMYDDNYWKIIRLFMDYPGDSSHMYAIHNIVQGGIKYDKLPGEWFGPSTAALVIRDLSRLHRRLYGGPIEVVVSQGDTLYLSDVEKACTMIPYQKFETPNEEEMSTIYENNSLFQTKNSLYQSQNDVGKILYTQTSDNPSTIYHNHHTDISNTKNDCPATAIDDVISSPMSITTTREQSEAEILIEEKLNEFLRHRMTNRSNTITSQMSHQQSFFDPLYNPPPVIEKPWQCACVVFIPLRLGESTINSHYLEELKDQLKNPYSIGFIGGRIHHALYFVGYSEKPNTKEVFLGLDPHTCFVTPKPEELYFNSPNLNSVDITNETLSAQIASFTKLMNQFHIDKLDEIDLKSLDPSLSLGFYFRTRDEFESFVSQHKSKCQALKAAGKSPLFHIENMPSTQHHDNSKYSNYDENDGLDEEDLKQVNEEDDDYIFV